eukprot:7853501-Alexandrium_andersonii.AAC.1
MRTAQRAADLRREAAGAPLGLPAVAPPPAAQPAASSSGATAGTSAEEMLKRIDGFEALLLQHSDGSGAARARATSAEPETPAAKRPAVSEESPVDAHIKRLRHRA